MRRDINFFNIYRRKAESGSRKFNIIALSVLLGSIALLLAAFSVIKFSDVAVTGANNKAAGYIQSHKVKEAQKAVSETDIKIDALTKYKEAAGRVSSGFSSLPVPDSAMLSYLAGLEPEDVTVKTVEYAAGLLTLTCGCNDNASPAAFVHAIGASGKFGPVNYNGFTSGASSGTAYSFTVGITLKGGAFK